MKHLKKTIGWVLPALMLLGCTPEPLPIKLDKYEPKLVISSRVVPGQRIYILVTKSFSALELKDGDEESTLALYGQKLLVKNAEVTLRYDGQVEQLSPLGPSIYRSEKGPQKTGMEYSLYVRDSETGLEATATAVMLPKIDFKTIDAEVKKKNGTQDAVFDYAFKDPAGEPNWYMINVISRRERQESQNAQFDLNEDFENGTNVLRHAILIKDGNRDGQTIKNEFTIPAVLATDSFAVALSNISEEYYNYLFLRQEAGSLFNEVLGEPINYPTNVENGFGFFTTHEPDTRFFDMKDYIN